uniref:STAS domain-containing protein n=1 Tax=Denticeps clupeoides TaxID=299321 RepID=A0AAY4B6Z9_9TELE
MWRVSKLDAVVWTVTMASSALISVEIGLLIGVVFSILCVVVQTQNPKVSLLGQIHNSNHYEDLEEYNNILAVPKVKIFRFQAPLYYANKDLFLKSVYKAVELAGKHVEGQDKNYSKISIGLIPTAPDFHTIILDCSSMPFIDSTGMYTIKGLIKDYKEVGIKVLLACCNATVIDSLRPCMVQPKNMLKQAACFNLQRILYNFFKESKVCTWANCITKQSVVFRNYN